MPGAGPILSAWMSYRIDVIPSDAPEIQVTECRRAFYSGALAVWAAVMDVSPEDDATEEDIAKMSRIEQEFDDYRAELDALLGD